MKNWTSSAKQKLDEYFARIRGDLQASGADVEEVTDDLRRHVEEEVAGMRLAVVTEADVGNILGRIGTPEPIGVQRTGITSGIHDASIKRNGSQQEQKVPGWWVFFLGVLLPLGTVVFEFLTGACAAVLFDPLPNFVHVLLTLMVPATNLWVWWGLRGNTSIKPAGMAWVLGMSIGVACVYVLLFLPVSPFAVIGIVVYLLGLVPLAPYFALGASLFLQGRLASKLRAPVCPNLWPGVATGIAALLLASAPLLLSRTGMHMAASEETATRVRGIKMLRTWGLENELLRACYGRMGQRGALYSWGRELRQEDARRVYYEVYGRAFNSVPPPKLYAGRARWSVLEEEFTWDNDQGGDKVAGRVKGLGMTVSRQDVVVDAKAAVAYIEWTMEFRNNSPLQREARAQVLLPEGSVVSRLTLWIEGEEREAAFGGRGQVKTAYKEVVAKRRDPVLVTTCGPDRVLVQCFPVQPSGGLMKARIGITAPLLLENASEGVLRLPCFIERNFTMREDLKHSVWLDSNGALSALSAGLVKESKGPGKYSLRGVLSEKDLANGRGVVRIARDPSITRCWASDTRGESGSIILQEIKSAPTEAPGSVVMVVDGTRGMEGSYPAIAKALSSLPAGISFSCVQASDGVVEVGGSLRPADAKTVAECGRRLQKNSSEGGHDNTPALLRAWELCADQKPGIIVWVHGPQPEAFDVASDLEQRFQRGGGNVRVVSVQCLPGPNRILERLDGIDEVRSLTLSSDLESDLRQLFKSFNHGNTELLITRTRVESSEAGVVRDGYETSLQLVRLWAADETRRKQKQREYVAAMSLATLYQLVTPVSGAVVLETQEQYQRAGLEPVPATSVPMIPEPSPAGLLLVGLGLLWLKGRIGRVRLTWWPYRRP